VHWELPFFLCFSIFTPLPWHLPSMHSIRPIFPLQWQHIINCFYIPRPPTFQREATTRYLPRFFSFSRQALASTQPRHGRTSCPNNLTGYPTVPKHLSSLVLYPTNSPHYMFPAICLHSMIVEGVRDYSETSLTKYQ